MCKQALNRVNRHTKRRSSVTSSLYSDELQFQLLPSQCHIFGRRQDTFERVDKHNKIFNLNSLCQFFFLQRSPLKEASTTKEKNHSAFRYYTNHHTHANPSLFLSLSLNTHTHTHTRTHLLFLPPLCESRSSESVSKHGWL
jgi:hypothetical protein